MSAGIVDIKRQSSLTRAVGLDAIVVEDYEDASGRPEMVARFFVSGRPAPARLELRPIC